MHMFNKALAASLFGLGLLSGSSVPALALDESCTNTVKGHMAVQTDTGFAYEGLVTITGCGGMILSFEDGRAVAVSDIFERQSGLQFFEMNITFIAQNFFPPMPEEYRIDTPLFRAVPDLNSITADYSDLALDYQMGFADTVFFKFQDGGNVRFIEVIEVSGEWEINLS